MTPKVVSKVTLSNLEHNPVAPQMSNEIIS